MKRHLAVAGQLVIACLLMFTLGGCLKDKCSHTYTLYTPVYKTLTEVRAAIKSTSPQPLRSTGKIYLFGKYIFLNEPNRGIHIIDNSNPSKPKNISFIPIPGNVDMAVKGNTLYADCHSDLVTLDISNPQQVTVKKILDNVFPHRNNYYAGNSTDPDSVQVIAEWLTRDTTVDCDTYQYLYLNYYSYALADMSGNFAAPKSSSGGIGGSMARFTLVNDYLYAVSNSDLNVINVSAPNEPVFSGTNPIGAGIETIYPFKDKLFIGSNTGMFIYDVASNPASPAMTGQFTHVRSCDPVIADDNRAYVTLRSGTTCQGVINQLDVLDITSLSSPSLMKSYSMTNPYGLSKAGDLLFICDGTDGLKVYDAADPLKHKLVKKVNGLETFDVIAWNNIALVVAKEGLFQFDYSNPADIRLVSKMGLTK